MLTLSELEAEIRRLAGMIQAGDDVFPVFGGPKIESRPRITVNWIGYHYQLPWLDPLTTTVTTRNLDDLLYYVFSDITSALAKIQAEKDPIPDQDPRRLIFQKEVELLRVLSHDWAKRRTVLEEEFIQEVPYDDLVPRRKELRQTLIEEGQTEKAATEAACKQYPYPTSLSGPKLPSPMVAISKVAGLSLVFLVIWYGIFQMIGNALDWFSGVSRAVGFILVLGIAGVIPVIVIRILMEFFMYRPMKQMQWKFHMKFKNML
jgi:hypothetical protein